MLVMTAASILRTASTDYTRGGLTAAPWHGLIGVSSQETAMRVLFRMVMAAIAATIVWWIGKFMGAELRLLDWYIFFSIESVAIYVWDKTR